MAALVIPTTRVSPRYAGPSPKSSNANRGSHTTLTREILITDGATLGVCTALGALVDQHSSVMLPDPIYDAYEAPIALWGGNPAPIPTTLVQRPVHFQQPDSSKAHALRAPSCHLAQYTMEPRGNSPEPRRARGHHGVSPRRKTTLVISDEIYESLIYDGRRHISPASVSADARERTILINSLSKTYAMTGWRVGYCAGPEPIIRAMLLVLQQSSRGPATFVQDAAACALNADQECTRRMTAEYQERRDRVVARLRGIPGVEPLVPEGGLFVMVDVRGLGMPSDAVRRFLLCEAGVIVLHGSAYGPRGEGFLRVSFAAGGEVLEQGLERLREGSCTWPSERYQRTNQPLKRLSMNRSSGNCV